MKLTIFYSWQTTTDTKYNRNFIFICIEKAIKKLEKTPIFKDVKFVLEDAVRGEPGSVPIADTIAEVRVPNCDIFIADVSVVNYRSDFKKWLIEKIGEKYKPFQNNNVINEYGIARNAIGVKRIIGVLNSAYGSVKEDNENIPFDIRHLSFPIEYNYSKKATDKEAVQKEFITRLKGAINDVALEALQSFRQKYRPFKIWSDWETPIPSSANFYTNEKIEDIISTLKGSIQQSQTIYRILGLSGLGKTKILLEAFRPKKGEEASIILASRVLYCDLNAYTNIDITSIIEIIIKSGDNHILILDNCSKENCRLALSLLQRKNCLISIITVDSNPEEYNQEQISGVNYIVLQREDFTTIVDAILANEFDSLSEENITNIKTFSQSIPLMAVLLGDSLKKGEKFIGRLDNKKLLHNLLGSHYNEPKQKAILMSCSLFNFFGFDGDTYSQLAFIATSKDITSIDVHESVIVNDFFSLCKHYLDRQIFEKRGRYISMRPFPLAMYLCKEWLDSCSPQRLERVLIAIAKLTEPDRKQLSEAIAERMKYLGYDDKAQQIVEHIIGPKSPFDNAEVLNTELGSRFFRSFVEVNPIAVADNLYRNLYNKNLEELKNIKEGRRNLVWTLEKVCFDGRTFDKGIKVLYSLAAAENETWSNNATGQFLHLFNISLPGTESNLEDRAKIIEWGLHHNELEFRRLAIKAISVGLSYGSSSRMGGAEQQGTKRLYDYQPSFKEVGHYWGKLLSILIVQYKSSGEFAEEVIGVIISSMRSIYRARHGDLIFPTINAIAELKKFDWDECLRTLYTIRKFDIQHLTEEQVDDINILIQKLTKTDYLSKYKNAVTHFRTNLTGEFYSPERMIEIVRQLADEFVDLNVDWADSFPMFYKKDQTYSFHFGKRLYERLEDNKSTCNNFVDYSLKTINNIVKEDRDISVLGGFLSSANSNFRTRTYNQILEFNGLSYLLFYLVASTKPNLSDFELLFSLIDDGKDELNNLLIFSYYFSTWNLSKVDIEWLFNKLSLYGIEGYNIFLKIVEHPFSQSPEQKEVLKPLIKSCYYKIGVIRNFSGTMDQYGWYETIILILKDDNEQDFAQFVNQSFIESITLKNSLYLDHDAQRLYELLVTKYFTVIWNDLSIALLGKDKMYEKFYCLKGILGSHIGGVGRSIGVLFDGDIEMIFGWCKANTPLAPQKVAELAPIFSQSTNGTTEWHSVALRLINEFGNFSEVLGGLNTNMGNYSWTGSTVPLLEAKKDLFKKLISHNIQLVSDWATRSIIYLEEEIKSEKIRDEEMFL